MMLVTPVHCFLRVLFFKFVILGNFSIFKINSSKIIYFHITIKLLLTNVLQVKRLMQLVDMNIANICAFKIRTYYFNCNIVLPLNHKKIFFLSFLRNQKILESILNLSRRTVVK